LRGANAPVELRVGQQLKRSTDKIVEAYQSSAGRITSAAAAPKPKARPPRPASNNDDASAQASESASDLPDEQ
jgi:hypothetical protein